MDSVTWALVSGQMVYPRQGWMLQGSLLSNHPSWSQTRVRLELGAKFAQWLYQGMLEWVLLWYTYPTLVEPIGKCQRKGQMSSGPSLTNGMGTVIKESKGLDKWRMRYFSVREFVDLIAWDYIVVYPQH